MTFVGRVPQIDLTALLAEQNPQIDLKLEAYEISTRNFLKAVSNYKNRAISIIAERKNLQATERKRATEKFQASESEIHQCRLREVELHSQLDREQEERKDSELKAAVYKRQLGTLRERSDSIIAENEQFRALARNLRREKTQEQDLLERQKSRLLPELTNLEDTLACVIEGLDNDMLLVRFAEIDEREPDREFSFILDVSSKTYKVVTTTPHLPTLPMLVDELNESRDIFVFVKTMRKAFGHGLRGK